MTFLDRYDQKILAALDRNAAQSVSDLARAVRLGRDLVDYRLERLQRQKFISGFHAVVDPYRLGLTVFKTFLKVRAKPSELRTLFNAVRAHPNVYWSALTDGAWDLFFTCLAATPTQFWEIQQEVLAPFDRIVLEKEFATNMSFDMHARRYFGAGVRTIFSVGGAPIDRTVTKEDRILLRALSENARLDAIALGKRCGLSPGAARARVQRLEQDGVILGYKIEVNLDAFERTLFKARLFAPTMTKQQQTAVERHCFEIDEMTYVVRQLGSCPIELTIEAEDHRQFNEIIYGIKDHFSDCIQRVETLLMREESYKWWLA